LAKDLDLGFADIDEAMLAARSFIDPVLKAEADGWWNTTMWWWEV
jgi:hypothetical protein